MGLFNFRQNEEKPETETGFIGRHQEILIIKHALGENVPDIELQMATNKDIAERNEIVEKLDELEAYMRSDAFTHRLDVLHASKEIDAIIDKGYQTSVLPNDSVLENRCLIINQSITEYVKDLEKKNGTLTEEKAKNLDKIIDLRLARGFLIWMTLGDKLTTSDEQHAWMIKSSLNFLNKPKGGFDKTKLVKDVISIVSVKDMDGVVENFKSVKAKLLENKQITESDAKKIDELIERGIAENKTIHQQHPERS